MQTAVMTKLRWYANRLRAMSLREVGWRVSQHVLQKREERRFARPQAVSAGLFYGSRDAGVKFDADFLGLRFDAVPEGFRPGAEPRLLGGFAYAGFAGRWHAGFQTPNEWPLVPSYRLCYKQDSTIGDARCNWELNRHFQFPLMAADFYATGNQRCVAELHRQFSDWNRCNPFLWGISWTSVMEVAIRSISWMLTLAFLEKAAARGAAASLREELSGLRAGLSTGVLNMTGYVVRHRSRHSSANNHLLVEMTAVGLAGLAFGRRDWVELAESTLGRELEAQNSPDGVNLEMSLHYHAFVMEAYLLMMRAMRLAGRPVPERWRVMLGRMAEFLCHSMVSDTAAMEFGDADEGKIIDLAGGRVNYYNYILQLASLETGRLFSSFSVPELTVGWLYSTAEIEAAMQLPAYDCSRSRTFSDGGYTFLRSADGATVVGVDHAPLGFGSIAAHGHADAMSIQLYDHGRPVLADSGTFLYHAKGVERDLLRSEMAHNTVCLASHPQSQMLGAFLWGRRCEVMLKEVSLEAGMQTVAMEGHTFDGTAMGRTVKFDPAECSIEIVDRVHSVDDVITFISPMDVVADGDEIMLGKDWVLAAGGHRVTVESVELAPRYGEKAPATAIRLRPLAPGESRVTVRRR